MKSLSLNRSLSLYEEGLELIPWASQTASKRPTEYAFGAFPIYIERGQGARVWDADGNEFIDYILGLGPITLGYCYEAIDNAARAQMEKGAIFGLPHPVEIEAARAVVETVPSADMARFFKTGAEATSAAVRTARVFTGREIVLHSGYHGWLDSVASSVQPGIPDAMREVLHSFEWNNLDALEAELEKYRGKVAAVMISPVSYYEVSDGSYLRGVRELCDKHEVVLIYDEIVTGYRMALGGAQEYFGVLPDLSCFAKGIANGYPVACLSGKREVMSAMQTAIISSTYGGEAISLAALVACVREYQEKNVTDFLNAQGQKLMDGLNAAAQKIGVKARWLGYPCMSAYAFENEDAELNRHCITFWLQECAKRGVLFRRGGLNFITFSHDDEIINETIKVGAEVLELLREAIEKNEVESRLETTKQVRGRYEQ
jgi:glutamate-1-semialdehyde aminotransferase